MEATTTTASSLNHTKRPRDAVAGVDASPESEAKRLRAEDFLDMLDDEADAAAAEDLASVMRSFEEEIAAGEAVAAPQPELGFLLEASDDELGLPPAGASSSEDASAGEPEEPVVVGFGAQIWGFEDETSYVPAYGNTSPEAAAAAAAAAAEWDDDGFDAGLFGFADDAALRHETMPAV